MSSDASHGSCRAVRCTRDPWSVLVQRRPAGLVGHHEMNGLPERSVFDVFGDDPHLKSLIAVSVTQQHHTAVRTDERNMQGQAESLLMQTLLQCLYDRLTDRLPCLVHGTSGQ